MPSGLLRPHTTKDDTWGRIVVEQGRLQYEIRRDPPVCVVLRPSIVGVIPPQQPHNVKPLGTVRFFVELWRQP